MADPANALGFGGDRLDDYADRPKLTPDTPSTRRLFRGLTVVGALAVGYLLAYGFSAARGADRIEDERHAELVELVREQRDRVEELNTILDDVGEQLAVNEERVAGIVPALDEALHSAELSAGVSPVIGQGVVVTLYDAPPGCTGASYLCRVQDYDLQLAVNSLFAAGAEAVSIGQQRVVATTAIRAAGSQITANYRFLAAPYEIRAVGDPETLLAAMQRDGLAVAFDAAGSGLRLEMREAAELRVPGLDIPPAIRTARPVDLTREGADAR